MHGSQYVTSQLRRSQYATSITNQRRILAAKFFSSSHDEDQEAPWLQKLYGVQTQQLLHKNDELGQILSPVTICLNKFCSTLVQLVSSLMVLKIIFLYVQGCEKRKLKHIPTDQMKTELKNLFFINLNRQPSIELAVKSRVSVAFKIILIYVQGCEKRKPKHIPMDWMKTELKNLFFINLNRYLFVEQLSTHRLKQLSLNLDRCQLLSQLLSFNLQHFHT